MNPFLLYFITMMNTRDLVQGMSKWIYHGICLSLSPAIFEHEYAPANTPVSNYYYLRFNATVNQETPHLNHNKQDRFGKHVFAGGVLVIIAYLELGLSSRRLDRS